MAEIDLTEDITDAAEATVNARTAAHERAWYERRGFSVPLEYLDGCS